MAGPQDAGRRIEILMPENRLEVEAAVPDDPGLADAIVAALAADDDGDVERRIRQALDPDDLTTG